MERDDADACRQSPLAGRRVLFGVTGSIAAFKAAGWVRELTRLSARVEVVMTRAAERFVTPLTFGALSGQQVHRDLFDSDPEGMMAHINLSRRADVLLIAPATAQTIARLAHGLADDLLSTVVLAARIPVVLCPAMNSNMFTHPATQANIRTLRDRGTLVIEPGRGELACGEEGPGRLPEWELVHEYLARLFTPQDLEGKKVVISAGPTREPMDPARYLGNRSSGRMGYALAVTAARRGADVDLVSGPVALPDPPMVAVHRVGTAAEMMEAVMRLATDADIVVMAAAVADFRPGRVQDQKIKKRDGAPVVELEMTPDILAALGAGKQRSYRLVGFAAESRDHVREGRRKLRDKGADLMVVNDILSKTSGFDVPTNQVTLVDDRGEVELPLLSKTETADRIWDHLLAREAQPMASS